MELEFGLNDVVELKRGARVLVTDMNVEDGICIGEDTYTRRLVAFPNWEVTKVL